MANTSGVDAVNPTIDTLTYPNGNPFGAFQTGDPLSKSVYDTIGSQVSGAAYNPYKTASNDAMARAAANLRATTGTQFAPKLGQGSAVAAQDAVEQSALTGVSQNQIGLAQGEQAMKNQGIANFNSTGALGLNAMTSNQDQQWKSYQAALAAGDFKTAADTYKAITGNTLSTDQLQLAQKNANTQTSQAITSGDITIAGMTAKLGTDKYNAIQNMVNTGATVDQINAQYGAGTLSQGQYDSMKAVSSTTLAFNTLAQNDTLTRLGIVSSEKIAFAGLSQQDKTLAQSALQFNSQLDFNKSELAANLSEAEKNRIWQAAESSKAQAATQTIAGMQISSNKEIAQLQITSAQKLAADSNYLTQQGIDINKASVEGYTAADGTHVFGSAEIAAQSLGLQAKTVDNAAKEAFGYTDVNGVVHTGSMDNATAAQQDQAKSLFGYTDANGNHVAGSLELQASSVAIQKQGMDLQTAQTKGYIDEKGVYHPGTMALAAEQSKQQGDQLYGYTAADGTKIPGTAELAKNMFGLQSDTLAMQKDEIKQKYNLLNAEDKRAADALYGKDVVGADGKTIHYAGSMEIQSDQLEIQKAGLSLTEAGLKGYDKTNADGTTTHVDGSLEIASQQFGLATKTYQDQHNEMFGYYDTDKKAWVPGKIDSMNEADKNAAYALYGDPSKGIKGSVQIASETAATQNQIARDTFDKQYGAGGYQDRLIKMQEDEADSKKYWDGSKKFETDLQTHLDWNADASNWNPLTDKDLTASLDSWYMAKYGKDTPPAHDSSFIAWARTEVKAGTDKRLTNPIDQSIYAINSSTTLTSTEKAQYAALFKQLPADTTFSVDKNGVLVASSGTGTGAKLSIDKDGKVVSTGGTSSTNFTAGNTIDATTNPMSNTFAEGGAQWTGEGKTSPIVAGDNITIKGNATVQNSSVVIPAGNYVAQDATHLVSVTPDKDGNYTVYDTTGKSQPKKDSSLGSTLLTLTGSTDNLSTSGSNIASGVGGTALNGLTGGVYGVLKSIFKW